MRNRRFLIRSVVSRACATLAVAAGLGFSAWASSPTPRPGADGTATAERPVTLECYYRARWGHADEFLGLFRKNHLPVLRKLTEKGRILKVSAVKPRYHATEDGRWDYRVTIVFKNDLVAHDPSYEDALKKELFPDQETFKKEEQRRFEILDAHWDLPVDDVALDE